jgi:hypothetical protein
MSPLTVFLVINLLTEVGLMPTNSRESVRGPFRNPTPFFRRPSSGVAGVECLGDGVDVLGSRFWDSTGFSYYP